MTGCTRGGHAPPTDPPNSSVLAFRDKGKPAPTSVEMAELQLMCVTPERGSMKSRHASGERSAYRVVVLSQAEQMSDLFVDFWGTGTPVVLVHGSLATGAEEWQAQRPLADEGFRLLVPDRRGYGKSPVAEGEDFLSDADDIAELMGDGAHLVGHSYGGLGVLFAAARRPDATLSMTLLEPGSIRVGPEPSSRTGPCGRSTPPLGVRTFPMRIGSSAF